MKEILEFYGVANFAELIEQEETQILSSVQDGFCQQCGAFYGSVEPDAQGYHCEECGKDRVASLQCIVLS